MPVLSALGSGPNRHGKNTLGLPGGPAQTTAGPMALCFHENKRAHGISAEPVV